MRWRKLSVLVEKTFDNVLILYFLLFFFIGAYIIYDGILLYSQANDSRIQRVKPSYGDDSLPDGSEILQDKLVGWITIDNTKIDFPIMQGENNDEFLTKNPFGEYALSGSIFLDSRNKKNFSDQYSIIYGHHMSGGAMFGALDSYLKKGYLDRHKTGTLVVGKKEYDLTLFAVANIKATDKIIFYTDSTKEEVLSTVKKKKVFLNIDDLPKDDNERLISLTTCKTLNSIYRTVVVGKYSIKNQSETEESKTEA